MNDPITYPFDTQAEQCRMLAEMRTTHEQEILKLMERWRGARSDLGREALLTQVKRQLADLLDRAYGPALEGDDGKNQATV